jgi:protein-tyrosine phosphatase
MEISKENLSKKNNDDNEQKCSENEKIILFNTDDLHPCFICQSTNAYINQEGIFLCNDCFYKQKKEVFDLYMEKINITPSYNQILSNIYLGNEDTARDKKLLNELKIKNIVIAASYCNKFFPDCFNYKVLELDDAIDEDLLIWFPETFEFMDNCQGNILVHCVMGISRSASVVIGYIMYKQKKSFKDALNFVLSKREINPNTGFRKQLFKFEKILINNNYKIPKDLNENYKI